MQLYDTPRSLKEALAASYAPKQTQSSHPPIEGAFGNYDFPQSGAPLPVYRKPCGCIMKLVTQTVTEQHEQQFAGSQQHGMERGGKIVYML